MAIRGLLLPVMLVDASAAWAQQGAAPAPAIEELTITGSNVIRDGYSAPTPTSVVNREAINTFSAANIGDYLAQLPVFAGNQTPTNTRRSTSAGGAGLSSLNMRNLGISRTLVLLDGQRVVASQPTGQIDINPFPQQLVQRVDVVTGGASAVYGSDALAGAVNFVLDRHFTGYKFEAQGGMTDDGDNPAKNITMSGGWTFADERAHLLLSTEFSEVDGIDQCTYDFCTEGWNMIDNPAYTATNGLPQRIVIDRSAPNNMTAGGIITAGPLKGTAFGPGGVPYQFNYGTLVGAAFSQGGDWENNSVQHYTWVAPYAKRRNVFARASYELTDSMEVFAQLGSGTNDSLVASAVRFYPGTLRIQRDNAFMPESVRSQMVARNLTTLNFGTYNDDLGTIRSKNKVRLDRAVIGIDGDFDMFGSNWTYSGYYEYGESINTKQFWDSLKTPYSLGIDAVVNPATGKVVCRSTLTSPSNGCVPYNVFGIGVNTPEAINYVAGWSYAKEYNIQKVVSARMAGAPFNVPAGEVSLAMGIEYRIEDGYGNESINNARNESTFGNQAPILGKYDVTDVFAETVVPVFRVMQTSLNAVVRRSDYSTSGQVTTWKTGLTFQPHDDLLVRSYLSHDIRSPSRRELFATTLFAGNQVLDPFLGNAPSTANTLTVGNANLLPEVADPIGVGLVYTSSLIDGFTTSIDYYDIDIEGSIGTVAAQSVIDRCFAGETVFCSSLARKADGTLQHILIQPVNYVVETNRGIDFEASYGIALSDIVDGWRGDFDLRGMATHYLEASIDTGDRPAPVDNVGSNGSGPPNWKFTVTGSYSLDNMRVSLSGRGVSDGVLDTTFIECQTGCPVSTTFNRTIDNNQIDGAIFYDLSLSYRLYDMFKTDEAELFLIVQNLTDKEPEIFPRFGANPVDPASNPTYYDILGREVRFGIRTQF